MNNSEFQSRLAAQLEKAQIEFEKKATIKGFFADFVVYAPDGRTGANNVFVVLENLDRNWPSKNVYKPDGIVKGIQSWIAEKASKVVRRILTDYISVTDGIVRSPETLFAAMPFDRQFDDTFVIAMTKAAEAIGSKAIRVDKEAFTEDIVRRIKSVISRSVVLVADLSKSPCVQICSTNYRTWPMTPQYVTRSGL